MSASGTTGAAAPRAPLGPGALADRLAALHLVVETVSVSRESRAAAGYYEEGPRPTATVVLEGLGRGLGECVAWTDAEQDRFAAICADLAPTGPTTVAAVHAAVRAAEPFHAAAIEAAAIDLALQQAHTNLFTLAGRAARPVAICRSVGIEGVAAAGGPVEAIAGILAREPWARIKIDVEPGAWDASVWRRLAATGRVVVVDFKRRGDAHEVALAHRWLPEAWLEDPPAAALDPRAPWRRRMALDGYVQSSADLAPPPVVPGAVNVKAPRMGGPLEALRALEVCAVAGWSAYFGGMFEVGPGRAQARVLASLFTADAWNDLAPLLAEEEGATPGAIGAPRLPMRGGFEGFAPPPPPGVP